MRAPNRTFSVAALAAVLGATVISACETRADATLGVFRTTASLANITLSSGTLTPAFDPAITAYTAGVGFATDQITVTPTVTTPGATVLVNGARVPSGTASQPIPLQIGSGNNIDVVVTNPDGLATRTYTIAVTRSAF